MSIITLTTDYGLKDHYVGALKGKLYSVFPETKIIDISHQVDAFNIAEAAYILQSSYKNFPKGSVHFVGVDIEKTKENSHVAMQFNGHFFVCADNGILSLLLEKSKPEKLVEINIHNRMGANPSATDVFVQVAVHLAKGGALSVVGKEIENLKSVTEFQPAISENKNTISGNVIYIDNYGNLVTNISKKLFETIARGRKFEIILNSKIIYSQKYRLKTIYNTYSDIGLKSKYEMHNFEGEKLAIFNDVGFLEIGLYKSNARTLGTASSLLGLEYRDVILIEFFE